MYMYLPPQVSSTIECEVCKLVVGELVKVINTNTTEVPLDLPRLGIQRPAYYINMYMYMCAKIDQLLHNYCRLRRKRR